MGRASGRRIAALAVLAAMIAGCGDAQQTAATSQQRNDPDPAATTTTAAPTPTPTVDLGARGEAAAAVVREFYAAVDAKRFSDAWGRFGPAIQQQLGGLATWQAGYAHTRSTRVDSVSGTASDPTHATVEVRLHSVDEDACTRSVTQRFAGTWTLRRVAGRWQASKLAIAKTGGGTLRQASRCTPSSTTQPSSSSSPSADSSSADSPADPDTSGSSGGRVCYPSIKLETVHLAAVHLPAVRLPAVTVGDLHIPARTLAARTLPAQTIPGRTLPGRCFSVPKAFALANTTVRTSNYDALDPGYSPTLTSEYWDAAPDVSVPDPTAAGSANSTPPAFPRTSTCAPTSVATGPSCTAIGATAPATDYQPAA